MDFTANQKRSYVGKCVVNIASEALIMNATNWYSGGPVITVPMPGALALTDTSFLDFSANIGEF